MAFNPFHGFRKHKKVIFAIMTIICMFTFVLSGGFGRGDAFEWLLSKIGASSKQGSVVTTLYGDKVYEAQIHERQRLRRLANQFVATSFMYPENGNGRTATMNQVRDALLKPLPRDPNADQFLYRELLGEVFFESMFFSIIPQFAHMGVRFPAEQIEKVLEVNPGLRRAQQDAQMRIIQLMQTMEQGRPEMANAARMERFMFLYEQQQRLARLRRTMAKSSPTDRDVLDGVLTLRALEMWGLSPAGQSGFLFGGSDKTQSILDFKVWQKQADTLGIKLTEEDVRNCLALLTPARPPLTGKTSEDLANAQPVLRGSNRDQGYDLATLYKALIEEFRVLLAQGIIMGDESGMFQYRPNAFREALGVTPGEYLDFYREQRRTSDLVLLPVPTRAFIDALKEEIKKNPGMGPTEEQLRTIYETYSKYEPSPSSSRPGLKIPRRVRVQWIADGPLPPSTFQSAAQVLPLGGFLNSVEDPREKFYLDRARAHEVAKLSNKGVTGLAEIIAGGIGATLAERRIPGVSLSAALDKVKDHTEQITANTFDLPTVLKPEPSQALTTALQLPEVVASGIGSSAGSPLTAIAGWHKSAQLASNDKLTNVRTRARVLAGLVGSSTTPLLAVSPWASAEYQGDSGEFKSDKGKLTVAGTVFDAQIPLKVIWPQVVQEIERKLVKRLQTEEMDAFQKRFGEAKGNEELARRVINEFVTEDVPLRKRLIASAVGQSAAGSLAAFGAWQQTMPNLVPARLALQHATGVSQSAADNTRYTLASDPGLRSLFAGYLSARGSNDPRAAEDFGTLIVSALPGGPYEAMSDPQGFRGSSRPASFPAGPTTFYYWLTKNEKADTPRQADAAEAIYQIWLEQEARELARRRAEEIRDQLKGKSVKEAEAFLKKLAEDNPTWGHLIRLTKVSRQEELETLGMGLRKAYRPYRLSEHDIQYPTSGFVNGLMKLSEGQAGVFNDEPEKHFYVAFVVKANEAPSTATAFDSKLRDQLLKEVSQQQKLEKQKAIMHQLRLQAGELDSRGRFALNPSVKKDDEGSQSVRSDDE